MLNYYKSINNIKSLNKTGVISEEKINKVVERIVSNDYLSFIDNFLQIKYN